MPSPEQGSVRLSSNRTRQVGGISRTGCYRGWRYDLGRAPVLLQERGGQADMAGRPRRGLSAAAPPLLHILQRPLLRLGPARGETPWPASGRSRRCWWRPATCGRGWPPPPPETNFEQWVTNRFGQQASSRPSSGPTPRRCGASRAPRYRPNGPPSALGTSASSSAARNAVFGGHHARDNGVIPTLLDQFHYPRLGPGMFWERLRVPPLPRRQPDPARRGRARGPP